MEYEAECFATLAQLLDVPDCAFAAHLAFATDPMLVTAGVAGHVALFAERVVDLTLDERRELFAETFSDSPADADRLRIVSTLRQCPRQECVAHLERPIEHLGTMLLRHRNPYAHLVVAIGGLLGTPPASVR
jgi:nitrate reductase assembly molybdenum cofactor insertion protein NarJ